MSLDPFFKCRPFVVPSYIEILKATAGGKKNTTEIASIVGESVANVGTKISYLKSRGLVKKLFGGACRYVVITEEGKNVLNELREG